MKRRDPCDSSEEIHSPGEDGEIVTSSCSETKEREHEAFSTRRLNAPASSLPPETSSSETGKLIVTTSNAPAPLGTKADMATTKVTPSSPRPQQTKSFVKNLHSPRQETKPFPTVSYFSVASSLGHVTSPSTSTDASPRVSGAPWNWPHSGTSNRGRTTAAQLAWGCVAGVIVLLLIVCVLVVFRWKRRKTKRFVVACSNADTAFDNLGFIGGRRISEFADLTELELVRVKVTNTVKRKVSIFAKEDYGKPSQFSCGRLDLVEISPDESSLPDEEILTS